MPPDDAPAIDPKANGVTPPAAVAAPAAELSRAPAPAAGATIEAVVAPAAPAVEPSPLASADAGKRGGSETKEPAVKDPTAQAKPEAAPAEAKPEDEAKPVSAAAAVPEALAETPKPPPSYQPYTVPEGFNLDQSRLGEFNTILAGTEVAGKADHAAMQELGQKLVDFYRDEVGRISEAVAANQRNVWNRLTEQRFNELKNDAELGGNRIDTTLGNAKYALEALVGLSKQEASQLISVMDAGGVSHHRLAIKMLNNIYELLREPEPVPPQLPSMPSREAGQRGWYNSLDGVKVA